MGVAHALHAGLKPFDLTEVISPVAVLDFLKLEISDLHEHRKLFHFFSISSVLRLIADGALGCEYIFSHASRFIF